MTETSKQKNQISNRNAAQPPVRCPFCDSQDTYCEAPFGTTHAYAQFYCRNCRTPFEWIKWEDESPCSDLPAFLKSTPSHPVSLS